MFFFDVETYRVVCVNWRQGSGFDVFAVFYDKSADRKQISEFIFRSMQHFAIEIRGSVHLSSSEILRGV